MLDVQKFDGVKCEMQRRFSQLGLADSWFDKLLWSIRPNSHVTMYCSKCKELTTVNFFTFDDHINGSCLSCDYDFVSLDDELDGLLALNVERHMQELVSKT